MKCQNHKLQTLGDSRNPSLPAHPPFCARKATHKTPGSIVLCPQHARGYDRLSITAKCSKIAVVIAIAVLASCGFRPSLDGDLYPDANGACCDGGPYDGHDGAALQPDASNVIPPDAAPTIVTLRQAATDTPSSGHTDQCLIAGPATRAQTYARIFPLVTGFVVQRVDFDATGVNASGLLVQIGTYGGDLSNPTLDTTAIAWLATTPAFSVSDGDVFSHAAIDASLPAGANMIVAVSSPDYASGSTFVLEGASGGETGPSYWQAQGCATPNLAEHDGRNNADVGTFIIDAIGYVP